MKSTRSLRGVDRIRDGRAKRTHTQRVQSHRRGMAVIDVVLSTAITFAFAFTMYLVAQTASGFMYQFISTMVGSPYL